jgi:hypothetical protein
MYPRLILTAFLMCFGIQAVLALPSFSRQTGKNCAACHLNVGELTPAGRQFKLMGYSAGDYVLPLSVVGVLSDTRIGSTASSANAQINLPKNGQVIPEAASAFIAGKFYEDFGGNIKWTLNAANTNPLFNSQGVQNGTKVGSDVFLDASEIRYTGKFLAGNQSVVLGVTLNNAPSVQDLWNTMTVNSYPYRTSGLLSAWGIGQFGPATLIDGGLNSQVTGVGVYTMVNESLYAEFTAYTPFSSSLSAVSLAGPLNRVSKPINPYWRLAYNPVRGADSFMLGTFGMVATLSNDANVPGSSGGKYTDIGFDLGYQHITDVHSWTAQMTYITEQVNWDSLAVVNNNHDNSRSHLNTFKARVSYDYQRRSGANVFSFYTDGSTDNNYWAFNQNPNVVTGACNQNNSQLAFCSANGSPRTSGYGFELYYVPAPYLHIALQQTFYSNFLGGTTFYDNSSGNVRAAKDNNLTYLYAVFSY